MRCSESIDEKGNTKGGSSTSTTRNVHLSVRVDNLARHAIEGLSRTTSDVIPYLREINMEGRYPYNTGPLVEEARLRAHVKQYLVRTGLTADFTPSKI